MFLLLIAGCNETGISSNRPIVFPDKDVSYLNDVEPFLKLTCTYAGCHGYSSAGNIRFDTHYDLMKIPGFVIPGEPNSSQIIQILENQNLHITYYYRENITDNHKQGMRRWVTEGARLN